jgi:superfamily II DNA/RNA helicase
MLDIGFLPDLQRICRTAQAAPDAAVLATFSPEIRRLAQSYLQDPLTEVAKSATSSSTVEHFYSVTEEDKRRAVRQLVARRGYRRHCIVNSSSVPRAWRSLSATA